MKKEDFLIQLNCGEWKTVSGYVSGNFGIYKITPPHPYAGKYSVTHLRTGANIFKFAYLKQAKDCVKRLELAIFPVPWEKVTMGNAKWHANKKKVKEIIELALNA